MKTKLLSAFLIFNCSFLIAPVSGFGQIITTVAGNGTQGYSGDGGPATAAELGDPFGIIFDKKGNYYFADSEYNIVRKVNTAGIISTISGIPNSSGNTGDGGQATAAKLFSPAGLAIDALGNIYIADLNNNLIRKINTNGIISTIAGIGSAGWGGDGGPATQAALHSPWDVTVDNTGNVYIADEVNNRVRMVNTNGIINTVAGGGPSGNVGYSGPATNASLNDPDNLALDAAGNLYIDDKGDSRIYKLDLATGLISVFAGNGTAGYSGDGGPATGAELNFAAGITTDAVGNLYIADYSNNRVRLINTTGIISTIVGNGTAGYSGDGGAATNAELYWPYGVALDSTGNLYITDTRYSRIRMVNNVGQFTGVSELKIQDSGFRIYPNPTINVLHIEGLLVNEKSTLVITDMLGNNVKQVPFNTQHLILNIEDLSTGVYFIGIETEKGKTVKKIIKN
ncbi:MAG: NHL domain-containing protein [Bacteroidia bacterium]